MPENLLTGYELGFLVRIGLSLLFGFLIGIERESRGKPAGISTHCLVIGGAALFTYISTVLDPNSQSRIAAQVVSGVGFIGAGMILKGEGGVITNLTTAAAIWFAASIGMAFGIGWYLIGALASVYALLIPRIPHISKMTKGQDP